MYNYSPYYSSLRVFGSTCFVLHFQVEHNNLSSHSTICVFLRYGESQKGYHCFDPLSYKLYVSHHVFFLEHIHFYFIPIEFHNVSKFEIIHINIFLDDTNSFPIDTSNLVLNHHGSFSLPMATPIPFETMDPPPHYVLLNVLVSLLDYQILFMHLIQIHLHLF